MSDDFNNSMGNDRLWKAEMIRCEYTNEAAGFTLSIATDRCGGVGKNDDFNSIMGTAKLQKGWPATETEEASPTRGNQFIRITNTKS